MHDLLNVAVVGAGRMGYDHVERLTDRIAGARVSAIVEPDARRADAAAERAGARAFPDLATALEFGGIDAALIATPGAFHEPVLLTALERGLPVLCEKPLTQDPASSLRVLEAEQRLDRPHIQVGFMRRFDPEYALLRTAIEERRDGELLMLRGIHRNPSVPDDYTQAMLITDSVVHEFDVMPWLAGSSLASVEVRYARRNGRAPERLREPILVLMELDNGVLVDVEMNVSVGFGYQVTAEAVCESGVTRIGQPSGPQRWSAGAMSVAEHETFVTRFAQAYDRQVQAWVDAVRDGSLVAGPTAWDGYLVALACEAGVRALDREGRVAVDAPERPAFYA